MSFLGVLGICKYEEKQGGRDLRGERLCEIGIEETPCFEMA